MASSQCAASSKIAALVALEDSTNKGLRLEALLVPVITPLEVQDNSTACQHVVSMQPALAAHAAQKKRREVRISANEIAGFSPQSEVRNAGLKVYPSSILQRSLGGTAPLIERKMREPSSYREKGCDGRGRQQLDLQRRCKEQ